jgi:hypothetical protein
MTRILAARLFLAVVGVAVWGYGQRADLDRMRLAGMAILLVVLLMRFVPRRLLGATDDDSDTSAGE